MAKVQTKAGPPLDTDDRYMSVGDVADYLGVNKALVYRLMRSSQLPYIVVGSRRRVKQSDVQKIIEAGR